VTTTLGLRRSDLAAAGLLGAEALASLPDEIADPSLPALLLELGLVARAELDRFLEQRYRMRWSTLDPHELDERAQALVPLEVCRRRRVVPIGLEGSTLVAAIDDPREYVAAEQALAEATGLTVRLALADPRALEAALAAREAREAALARDRVAAASLAGLDGPDVPATELFDRLLDEAVARRASDLHLEPCEHGLRARLRVDGELRDAILLPREAHESLVARIKVLASMDVAERRRPQDGHVRRRVDERENDQRVASMPSLHGERVVVRVLDAAAAPRDLDQLGLDPADLARFERCLAATHGLVLATGPTGSGKTTTLYAALRRLARPGVNVMTLEDPIEYRLDGATQVQVHEKAGLDFAAGLRGFLRQDPDVIMVGEIRNQETAQVAVRASLTGHLVLSTLHMHSAEEAVARLLDMGVEPYLLASTLRAVLAQRLVRRVCEACAEPDPLDAAVLARLGSTSGRARRGRGCARCEGSGSRGRTAVTQILVLDRELRAQLPAARTPDAIAALARARGARSLADSALAKVAAGEVALGEVRDLLDEERVSGEILPQPPDLT
jgi:type II secretory ATPase GspE/PulE/Tfp pilus assembly ATPase PilB-like protein